MHTGPANANGHRRRQIRARVLVEETHCRLCSEYVDKTLTNLPGQHGPKCRNRDCTGCVPHPRRAEVDEDIPRSRGGSALERSNVGLLHRECNAFKSSMTMAEARAKHATQSTQHPHRTITTLVNW